MGTLTGSYASISDRLSTIVAGNEKLFFLKYHISWLAIELSWVIIRSVSSTNHVSGGAKRYVERTATVYNTWTCLSSMVHITLHGCFGCFTCVYERFWADLKKAKFHYVLYANEPQKFHHSDVVKCTSSAKTTCNAFGTLKHDTRSYLNVVGQH